jgi:DNA repair protein RecO (recombination protein O)
LRRHVKSRALILSGRDLGESDRIITFLSEQLGKFSAVAKGARRSKRRFAGALELFSLVELCAVDSGAGLLRLESCDLLEPYPAIRGDLKRFAGACYLCELAAELFPEREQAGAAFELLSHALAGLNAGRNYPWERVAELRLLALAGFRPQLGACQGCGAGPAGRKMRFSPERGGVLCTRCGAELPTVEASAGTLLLLGEALRLGLPRLARLRFSRRSLEESEALLSAFTRHILGKELKSRRFLESVEGAKGSGPCLTPRKAADS